MDYNYHTHTFRCHHADGVEEEYILWAIKNGIKHMGFSDHAPFECPKGYQSLYRVRIEEAPDYFKTIIQLREKYKNEIDISIGFEMEYYPGSFKSMLNSVVELGAEYLILGQHFYGEEYYNPVGVTAPTSNEDDLKRFVGLVLEGMNTGVFTYVAHPDMLNFVGDDEAYAKEMKKICEASKAMEMPLEINFCGMRGGRHYPNDKFWEIAGEVGCPVVFGCDAHSAREAYDKISLERAKNIVKRFGLNYIGKPIIKNLKNF